MLGTSSPTTSEPVSLGTIKSAFELFKHGGHQGMAVEPQTHGAFGIVANSQSCWYRVCPGDATYQRQRFPDIEALLRDIIALKG